MVELQLWSFCKKKAVWAIADFLGERRKLQADIPETFRSSKFKHETVGDKFLPLFNIKLAWDEKKKALFQYEIPCSQDGI